MKQVRARRGSGNGGSLKTEENDTRNTRRKPSLSGCQFYRGRRMENETRLPPVTSSMSATVECQAIHVPNGTLWALDGAKDLSTINSVYQDCWTSAHAAEKPPNPRHQGDHIHRRFVCLSG